jgi:aminopeptidase N
VTLTFSDHGAPNCAPGFFGMKFCNIDPDITYFGGCDWVPTRTGYTYADLIDAFDLTYTLTFPAGYESASSAERTDAADNGDGTVTHAYAQDGRWGMAFAVAQFDVWTGASGSGVPSRTYTWPGHDAYGQAWADLDADIIDFYEARYADYSLGKIDAVQVLQELGGGFATPSAVFQYEDSFDADPAGDLMSESIFAHEIGHQWWAFIVPLAEVVDLYSPWLSEGFAEFSAYTYSADVWGDYYIDYYHDFYAQLIQYTIAAEDEQPISGMDTGALDDNDYFLLTYEKGAYVLRMLRLLLGDEDFYAGMRAFAEGPGTLGATTDSFQATMEESSGVDLEDFFQQWAWGTGWPHYTIAFETGGDDASGYATTVRVTQAQADLFAMPVPIVLYVGEDEEETHVETIDGPEHEFTYPTASPVRGVKLDPRSLVLARREPVLHGDFNGSGEVDGLDLMYLAFAYRSDIVESANNWIGDCDIDFDGRVDERDLTELTANFGKEGAL